MMSLSQAAHVLHARVRYHVRHHDAGFTGVSTDTRTLERGDLFVALRGEHFDGHAFLGEAQAAGAAAVMVDTAAADTPLPAIVVEDTRCALGALGAHWRARFPIPLVALTGSSGKTTVKEMLAGILREASAGGGAIDDAGGVLDAASGVLDAASGMADARETVLATRGNLNNDIGMPLTLLALKDTHRYAVIEMGMNHAGEIAYLAKLAAPDVAVITNAGRAHIEFLGSEEAIASAKGEIFEGLKRDGTAVINADDRHADTWRGLAGDRRRVEFGLEQPAEVTAAYQSHALTSEIVLKTPGGEARALLRAPGVHNVVNALAAAAAAVALDVPVATIAAGLERYAGVKGRLQIKRGVLGATLIDDTYNANPESMRAAIAVLTQNAGRTLLILGDMGELGARASELHAALGAHAREAGVGRLITLGEHSAGTARAFGAGATHHGNVDDLITEAKREVAAGVTVLVKGSRFMRMERVVAALEERSTCF